MGKLYEELKRRKVFRVAAVYAVVAWVLIQVADTVLPALQMPEWTVSFVTVLFILGFIPTLIAAWAYEITPDGVKSDAVSQPLVQTSSPANQYLIYATFLLVLVVASFQVFDRFSSLDENSAGTNQATSGFEIGVMRAKISLGEIDPQPITINTNNSTISPDGTLVASTAYIDGIYQVRLRNIDELQFRTMLEGSDINPISGVLFSPDSQRLLLDTGNGLQVLDVDGAPPIMLATEITSTTGRIGSRSYAWLDNEWVVFRNRLDRSLYRASIVSRQTELLYVNMESRESFKQLATLPDSNRILATIDDNLNPGIASNSIYIVDITTGAKTRLINNAFAPHYLSSGHIAFIRDQALWVVSFDVKLGETMGAEYATNISPILASQTGGFANYSVTNSGLLVYQEIQNIQAERELVWVDIEGNRARLELPPGRYRDPVLSPEGDRLVLTLFQLNGDSDLWVFNLQTNTLSRVTFSGEAFNVIWSLDGERLIYERSGSPGIWISNANGIGDPQRITTSDTRSIPNSITPDGSQLIYMSGFGNAFDFSEVSLEDENHENRVLLASGFNEVAASISPDGNWLAYNNNETGMHQIYLRPYPNVNDGKWQITSAGGWEASWGPDGETLYYVSQTNEEDTGTRGLYSVPLTLGADVSIGTPTRLATGLSVNGGDYPNYDVHPDERQFIGFEVDTRATQSQEEFLILVSNWFEELNRLAPSD